MESVWVGQSLLRRKHVLESGIHILFCFTAENEFSVFWQLPIENNFV